jgi:WD40 repeat protein
MSAITIQKLQTITGHRDCIYTIEGSSLPHRFFSGSGDGMVVKWDLNSPDSGELIAKLPNSVYALHFHPGSGLLIAGHNYQGIHVLDWENKKETGSLQLTGAAVFDIRSAGDFAFVASGDGTLTKVYLPTLSILKQSKESEKSARCIDVNPETMEIAVGYSDNKVRVFDLDLNLKKTIDAHLNSVFTVRFSPDYKHLITGSRDARLKVWDVGAGYTLDREIVAHLYAINHVDYSPDKKHFVTCSLDKTLKVWDAEEYKLLKVIDRARHGGHLTSVNKVLWTAHQDQLLSASDDRTISVWHIIF